MKEFLNKIKIIKDKGAYLLNELLDIKASSDNEYSYIEKEDRN